VEQKAISKVQQKLRFRAAMAVLHTGSATKNAKNGDKTLSPNPSFLLPKFAILIISTRFIEC